MYYKFYGTYTTDHTFTVEKLTGYQYFHDVSIPQPDHEFVFYNRTHTNGTSTFTDTYNDSIVATASGNANIQDKYALQFQGGYLDVTPWTIGSAFTMEFVASYHSWTAFSKIIDFGNNITFGDARVFDSGGNTDTPNEVGGSFKVSSSYYFRTVRIQRNDAGYGHYLNIHELQVWIGGVNVGSASVAGSGSATALDYRNYGGTTGGLPSYINDDGFGHIYHSNGKKTNNWCQIELAEDYNFSLLQSVVIYNRTEVMDRLQDCRIDLIKENGEILYSTSSLSSSQANNFYIRFDGPDINNVASSLFTTSPPSTTHIANPSSSLYINTDLYNSRAVAEAEPEPESENDTGTTINFNYQPYDYTLSGNENFYVSGATYLYNFYIDSAKTEYVTLEPHGYDFYRIIIGLNDPNSVHGTNFRVAIHTRSSGYLSINQSLTTVTGGTSLNSNDPYYLKVNPVGGRGSLLYKTNNSF